MEFIDEALSAYCEQHTQPESEVLQALNRETHMKVMSPRMLSGHLQGRFLSFIARLMRPQCILEIGTYTGYSALCLAEGLPEGAKLISIDINEETDRIARRYVQKAGMETRIELITGNALEIIPELRQAPDLVFIDADKRNYAAYFDLVIDKVRSGAVIIADNVLWSGKVVMPESEMDKDTLAIHRFNQKVHNDARVEHMLLPLRDGLLVMQKK